jgi:HD domain
MGAIGLSPRVTVARALAEVLLDRLDDRWAHTVGVALRAEELTVTLPTSDGVVLLVAAWLHDIGHSPTATVSGFHPLDAAAYLDGLGWPSRVCGLVAHHSGANLIADALGLREQLDRYPDEQTQVSDALTYADQTVGLRGEPLTLGARMADMLARHGPRSVQAQVHHLRGPHLEAAVERAERRLADRVAAC